jgi:hypothetical protein
MMRTTNRPPRSGKTSGCNEVIQPRVTPVDLVRRSDLVHNNPVSGMVFIVGAKPFQQFASDRLDVMTAWNTGVEAQRNLNRLELSGKPWQDITVNRERPSGTDVEASSCKTTAHTLQNGVRPLPIPPTRKHWPDSRPSTRPQTGKRSSDLKLGFFRLGRHTGLIAD